MTSYTCYSTPRVHISEHVVTFTRETIYKKQNGWSCWCNKCHYFMDSWQRYSFLLQQHRQSNRLLILFLI